MQTILDSIATVSSPRRAAEEFLELPRRYARLRVHSAKLTVE
jgi:hypothetical protein